MAYNPFQPPKAQTTVPGIAAPSFSKPWLLYVYPWMPYPRRVILYLREKGIPETQVAVVQVRDPMEGDDVVDQRHPSRPSGSLPILAIPFSTHHESGKEGPPLICIRQSNAIMMFLEELCNDFQYGFGMPHGSFLGKPGTNPLQRARITELWSLADECMVAWNPVRIFGTGAGTIANPEAAKEMLRWVCRSLGTIETFLEDRDMSLLREGVYGHVNMADIALFQFLDFVEHCYGVDITIGSGQTVEDVYGREVKENYPKLVEFYQAFKTRASTRRDNSRGEVAPEYAAQKMRSWHEGVL